MSQRRSSESACLTQLEHSMEGFSLPKLSLLDLSQAQPGGCTSLPAPLSAQWPGPGPIAARCILPPATNSGAAAALEEAQQSTLLWLPLGEF